MRTIAICIVMIDEVEKAFAGVGGGVMDSGVSSRMFGTFLTWLNDHTSDAYVVCTSNDVSKLPPEFGRAERFDALFMVDLPSREEKDLIWQMYERQYGLDVKQRPIDENWTGAEIKSCCRLAALHRTTLLRAAKYIVPVCVTAADKIDALRTWASGRCLHASREGHYEKPALDTGSSRRRVNRASQNN